MNDEEDCGNGKYCTILFSANSLKVPLTSVRFFHTLNLGFKNKTVILIVSISSVGSVRFIFRKFVMFCYMFLNSKAIVKGLNVIVDCGQK